MVYDAHRIKPRRQHRFTAWSYAGRRGLSPRCRRDTSPSRRAVAAQAARAGRPAAPAPLPLGIWVLHVRFGRDAQPCNQIGAESPVALLW